MNSVLSRAPSRRGGRRPGWTLMTALLILAIAASSALVFTNRVELLKLAVIIALWAAVAAAFVSVIYRRQSDVDQARARDLKLVYDLQLDREISARREYELTVESQLRRELASELRAQAADEVAALRTELAALRTNLEILFDTDLSNRPALETERPPVRDHGDWARTPEVPTVGPIRVAPPVAPSYPPASVTETAENPIIDVPEVRIPAAGQHAEGYRGSHRRPAEDAPPPPARPQPQPQPQSQPQAGRWEQPAKPFVVPQPPQPARPEPPAAAASAWQPVPAEGAWLPPGAPGSNWAAEVPAETGRHGRHAGSAETPAAPEGQGRRRARSRHSAEPVPEPVAEPVPEPAVEQPAASRHSAAADGEAQDSTTGGQSVAELLARLQTTPSGGRRRRRRED